MRGKYNIIFIIIAVIISIALIVSAFNPIGQDVKTHTNKVNIALIMRTASDDYWQYLQRGADTAARESQAHITIYAPTFDGDVEGQLKIANAVLESNPDVIIIGANADEPFSAFLAEANIRRVPIIAVDSLLSSGVTTSYIGANNFSAGQQAMDEMAQLINNEGKILLVSYMFGGINASLREAGVLAQLNQYNDIELVRNIECSINITDCQAQIKWVYENNSIKGVIALMNKPAEASALALKEAEDEGNIKIVGFDSSNTVLELMQEGYMQTLFVQNPFTQGYLSVKQAIAAAQGSVINAHNNMTMTKITNENMFWLQHQKLLFPIVN